VAEHFREIARELRFPEGPIWMSDGSVLVVEIARGCLSRVAPNGAVEPISFPGGGPNGAALGPDGKCYVCNNGGFTWHDDHAHGLRPTGWPADHPGGRIERVDLATGVCEMLYDGTTSGRLSSPNDIVFDRHGGFWFTDVGKVRTRNRDNGMVYYAKADGSSIREVLNPLISPNGIGLSPDEQRLFVAETLTGRIWAFDLSAPGEIARKPFPSPNGGSLLVGLPDYQLFDSLAVDSAGNVCVATLQRGGITVVSPDGDSIEHIPLPDRYTTNLCFGGPDLRTAFVTLSSSGRLVALDWPRPGLKLNYCA
jgi:gluconolactonase